jgi:serine/threonine-protein kinase RsbW
VDALLIKVLDDAPLFDPTATPTPDITVPLAQRPFGGMGVHMMREFVDELKYQVTANGRNQLTLVKHHAF